MKTTLARCGRCHAEGTAVEMGICCTVARLNAENALSRHYDPLPRERASLAGSGRKPGSGGRRS